MPRPRAALEISQPVYPQKLAEFAERAVTAAECWPPLQYVTKGPPYRSFFPYGRRV